MRNGTKPINLSAIYELDSPDDPSIPEDLYRLRRPFLRRQVTLNTGHCKCRNSGILLTVGLRAQLEIGSPRKRISDDIQSSWFVLDGEVVLREKGQPTCHPLREL